MAVQDGDNLENLEPDFELEDLTPEDREKFLNAIKNGDDTVELGSVSKAEPSTPPETPAVPPAAEPVKAEPTEEPRATSTKPKTYQEAMAALNTSNQKLEARNRLITRLGTEPEFVKTYLQERGIVVQYGQDPIAAAKQIEATENANNIVLENQQREIREAAYVALRHADTELAGYDTGLTESLEESNRKWEAVWDELGRDPVKAEQYVNDAEFRKTVKAQGPSDPAKYFQVKDVVHKWMNDPHKKPLSKHLDFHDVPRKAQPAVTAAVAKAPDPKFEEAKRLAQISSEPRTLPSSSTPKDQTMVLGIEDLLRKADDYGTDHLTAEERQKIKDFYASNS